MKLSFVEIAGFRGFKDKTRFRFPAGFVVLTGSNGVGKSTVLDAIDFALTGTINKYSVTEAKGGGLESHIWWLGAGAPDSQYVSAGFVEESGEELIVTRSRERGLETSSGDVKDHFWTGDAPETWPQTMMQTSLIRDETIAALSLDLPEQARFATVRAAIGGLAGPQHNKRTAEILQVAGVALAEQKARVADARGTLGNALSALTEAQSLAKRHEDVSKAEAIIGALAPELAMGVGDRSDALRRLVAERKQSIVALSQALAQAMTVVADWRHFDSETGQAEMATARSQRDAARQVKDRVDKELETAQQIAAVEHHSDEFAAQMADLLAHGEAIGLQEHHCPLCAAQRSDEEFATAIAAARSKLSAQGARAAKATMTLEQARHAVAQAGAALAEASRRLEALEHRRRGSLQEIARAAELFERWGLTLSPRELEASQEVVLRRQEDTASLEQSLFILEASSAHDRVTTLEARVQQLRVRVDEETGRLTAAERAVETARQIDNAAKEVGNQALMEQFDTVMPLLKELYQRLRPHADWRDIEIDFGGRVRASLNLTVGDGRNPQFLFSSGQRRAAGVAFLLAVHLSRPWCRLRSLLLDDPVQHIDDYRSLNLVEVLSAVRRTGRQVIIAVEDPALADVLCRRLRSSAAEPGRRFELVTAKNGSAMIGREVEILPLPHAVLDASAAS